MRREKRWRGCARRRRACQRTTWTRLIGGRASSPLQWDVRTCEFAAERGRWECLRYAREVGADGADEFADVLDDYDKVWVHFIVCIAIDRRETTPELSARRFHELYKEFDARRMTLLARLRERANDISWKR